MTKPKHPPLPSSLTMPDALRRPLLKLTADGRARIVYDVTDAAQAMPHRAVVLHGRRLVAWVTATGWENDRIEEPGKTWSETIEALVPCPDAPQAVRYITGGTGRLTALCIRRVANGAPGEDGYPTEVRSTEWQRRACEDLTSAVGLLEILTPDVVGLDWRTGTVLVPDEAGAWNPIPVAWAESRARRELQVPLHSELVSRRGWVEVQTPAGAGRLCLESVSDAFPAAPRPGDAPVHLAGLTSIVLEGVPGVTLEARRALSDWSWSVTLDVAGRPLAFRPLRGVVDGAEAWAVVQRIATTFDMPAAPDAAPYAVAVAQSDFAELLARMWNSRRRLQFVLDALGIADAVQPPQIQPAG